jgi:hypothetical protein
MTDTPAVPLKNKPARRKAVAPVTSEAFDNPQLSLFQGFLANTDDIREGLSNAIDLWDNSPRFSVSRARMNTLRTAEGFLEELEIPFHYRGRSFKAVIYPARIKDKEGKRVSYYPSAREEIVEHALRKISAEQQAGFFDKPNARSGVVFSLHGLRKELEEQGHSLRYDEIVEALDILSMSVIDIVATDADENAEPLTRSTYLQGLTMVRRKDYDADRSSRCAAQFHPLITQSIDRVTYRQFNYQRLMKCRSQLARWLLSQLVLKYTQASMITPFEVRYSTVKRDSGLLDGYARQRAGIETLDAAWAELKELGALAAIIKNEQRGTRGKLEDVVYILNPTREFMAEQKAANRRQNEAEALLVSKASVMTLGKVDK